MFAFALLLAASPAQEIPPIGPPSPIEVRIRDVTEPFLGMPYRRSPLGEGSGEDPDPRFRTDAFDCLTLVETALALAYREKESEVIAILDDLRYREGEPPSFRSRLHLMEAQWLPSQIRKGYLEDVTAFWAGEALDAAAVELDPPRWTRREVLPSLPWHDSLEGRFEVPLLPLDRAAEIADALPEGLVLNVVREASPHAITRISHTGILVSKGGRNYVRHAALKERRVIDEPLDAFLTRHRRMKARPVAGIQLLAIRDNGERVERILRGREIAAQDSR